MNSVAISIKLNNLFLLILLIFLIPLNIYSENYYVDPNGDNINGDGSQEKPWQSLSYACAHVRESNDMIHLNSGVYYDNSQCILAIGVKIIGVGKSLVRITTSANPYILIASQVPVVIGRNEISGIRFIGNGSNICILSHGRSFQKIYESEFEDFDSAISIYGKYGYNDLNGNFWKSTYDGNESSSCIMFEKAIDRIHNTPPLNTDWAEGIEIYENTFINSKVAPFVLKDALIYDNVWDNIETHKSGLGHTGIWFNHVKVYNNSFNIGDQSWHIIAIEMWELSNECEFNNNESDAWFSLPLNTRGNDGAFKNSYLVHHNKLINNNNVTSKMEAIEVTNLLKDVQVFDNYIEGDAWSYGIAVWGQIYTRNVTIRNNKIFNVHNDGLQIAASEDGSNSGAHSDVDSIFIYNNVIDSPGNHGIHISGWDDELGDVDYVIVKNNIIMNLEVGKYGLKVGPSSWGNAKVEGCEYMNNITYGGAGHWDGVGAVSISGNKTWNPDLNRSGDRSTLYYRPKGSDANIVDTGIDVGFNCLGTAPDIGAYEYGIISPPEYLR